MQQKADGVRAIVTIDHAEGTVRAASRTCKPVALTVATINALNDVFPNGAILDADRRSRRAEAAAPLPPLPDLFQDHPVLDTFLQDHPRIGKCYGGLERQRARSYRQSE